MNICRLTLPKKTERWRRDSDESVRTALFFYLTPAEFTRKSGFKAARAAQRRPIYVNFFRRRLLLIQ